MSNSWLDEQIMMTLSGIAYYGDVSGQLKNPTYATQNDWSLVWGPVDDWYGNRAYAALSASTGKYAVAIRGTDTDFGWDAFINMYNDLNVLWQVEWDYFFASQGAMVSQGTYTQLSYLLDHATWDGQTLAQFIESIPAGTPIAVTGHSLGGNLATVLGAWISFKRGPQSGTPDNSTEIYTFAAPSPGNRAFASAYNARLPSSFRYWNSLDIVPRAWDNLPELYSIYDSIGIPTPQWIQDAIYTILYLPLEYSEWRYSSYYQQNNGDGSKLLGSPAPWITDWISEAISQHAVNTYLGLLNAPLIKPSANLALSSLRAGPAISRLSVDKEKLPPDFIAQVAAFSQKSSTAARLRNRLL